MQPSTLRRSISKVTSGLQNVTYASPQCVSPIHALTCSDMKTTAAGRPAHCSLHACCLAAQKIEHGGEGYGQATTLRYDCCDNVSRVAFWFRSQSTKCKGDASFLKYVNCITEADKVAVVMEVTCSLGRP